MKGLGGKGLRPSVANRRVSYVTRLGVSCLIVPHPVVLPPSISRVISPPKTRLGIPSIRTSGGVCPRRGKRGKDLIFPTILPPSYESNRFKRPSIASFQPRFGFTYSGRQENASLGFYCNFPHGRVAVQSCVSPVSSPLLAYVPKLPSLFSKLHQELLAMWPPIADLPFPVKRPMSRMLLGAVLEERIVALEVFLQGALSLLGVYAAIDPRYAWRVWWLTYVLGSNPHRYV